MKKIMLMLAMGILSLSARAQGSTKDIPSTVIDGFAQKYPEIQENKVAWDTKGDLYKASFAYGKSDYKAFFNNKGQWVSSEMDDVPLKELPKEVTEGLSKSQYASWKVSGVEAKEKPGETIYKIEIENGMQDEEVYMNREGKLVDKNKYKKKG